MTAPRFVALPASLVARCSRSEWYLNEPAILLSTETFARAQGGRLLPALLDAIAEHVPRPFWVTSRPVRVPVGGNNGLTHWHCDFAQYGGPLCALGLFVTGDSRTEFEGELFVPEGHLALYDSTVPHRGRAALVEGPRWFVRVVHPPAGHWVRRGSNRLYTDKIGMLKTK